MLLLFPPISIKQTEEADVHRQTKKKPSAPILLPGRLFAGVYAKQNVKSTPLLTSYVIFFHFLSLTQRFSKILNHIIFDIGNNVFFE